MRRLLAPLCLAAGVGLGLWLSTHRGPSVPDSPAVATRVRDVLRLTTLDVTLYKKISFAPDPVPSGTVWQALYQWARFTVHAPHGRAIVFARVELSYELPADPAAWLSVDRDRARVALPAPHAHVELLPAETEVIDSNLDSAQTAQLLELARVAFQRAAEADPDLRQRADRGARQAIEALLRQLGFHAVDFGAVG
jgi:Protein of unknown function (DUF4230)